MLTSNWSAKQGDGRCKQSLGPGEFFRRFPDEEAARLFLERRRWGERPACPKCGSEEKQYRQKRGGKEGYTRCNHCALVYTVRTGTFMERSHVPLHKWLYAIHSVETRSKSDPPGPGWLYRSLGISHTASSFMIQRIFDAMKSNSRHLQDSGFLKDIIPVEERPIVEDEEDQRRKKAQLRTSTEKQIHQLDEEMKSLEQSMSLETTNPRERRRWRQSLMQHSACGERLKTLKKQARDLGIKLSGKQRAASETPKPKPTKVAAPAAKEVVSVQFMTDALMRDRPDDIGEYLKLFFQRYKLSPF